MREIDYDVKTHIHWSVYALACLLIIVGIFVAFTPKIERIDLYSDNYYTYYTEVATYPYMTLGLIIDALGWLILLVCFLVGQE